jgi:hypothetical protein
MKILRLAVISFLPLFFQARARAQVVVEAPGPELVAGGGLLNVDKGEKQWLASTDWRFAPVWTNLRPWLGAAWAERGTGYLSAGLVYTLPIRSGWRISVGFDPTDYRAGNGKFLGENFEFYSFAETGYAFANGQAVNARFGHISNAHLSDYNPGTELLMLNWSIPFR